MIIRGHNSQVIEAEGNITIKGHNSGNVEACGTVNVQQHNSGDIATQEDAHIGGHNSGEIKSQRNVYVSGHNSGEVEAADDCQIDRHNSGEVLAKSIHYQGLKLTLDVLEAMTTDETIPQKRFILSRQNRFWSLEDTRSGSIQQLSIIRGRLFMECIESGGATITVNGTSINVSGSGSGSVTISNGGSVIIRG